MTNLTKNEKLILAAAAQAFNYGTAVEEKDDNAVMFNVAELAKSSGMSIPSVRGVCGSMFKKGMFCEMEGGEPGTIEMGITDNGIDAFYALDTFAGEAAGAVVVWYDAEPTVRSWTVLLCDAEGNQQGEGIYTASRADAQHSAEEIVREHNLTCYSLTNSKGVDVEYTLKANGKFKKTVAA